MTAHAARLERLVLVTRERLDAKVLVFQGFQLDSPSDSATLLVEKGLMGFVLDGV